VSKPIPPPVSRPKPPPIKRSVSGPNAPKMSFSAKSSTRRSRPPKKPIVVAALLFVLEVWFVFVDRDRVNLHILASILGLFGSVAVLGWFRQSLNLLRSTGSFSDWSGPFESTRYLSFLVFSSWLLGVINLYVSVYEKLRP
jgi:protein-S-isoprenylcysteine O-methyltransferase Ste14